MNVKIIVDSTADMRPEVAAKVGIVPLSVHFGDREFVSGVDINPKLLKIKSPTVSTVSPSISHEVMGPDAMIFVF